MIEFPIDWDDAWKYWIDFLVFGISLSSACLMSTLWLFSRQKWVNKTFRNTLAINLRTIAFVLTLLLVGYKVGASGNLTLILSPFILIGIFVALAISDRALGGFDYAFLYVAPILLIQQVILGFPLRHDIFLTPPKSRYARGKPRDFSGQAATVVAALRPFGTIEIQGDRFSAKTSDGLFCGVGSKVTINRVVGTVYIVSVAKEETPPK